MKRKNKLIIYIVLLLFALIPMFVYAYSNRVILGGKNIGIEVKSKGVLVVGFYEVLNESPGKDAGLIKGDIITTINGKKVDETKDITIFNTKSLNITYIRNNVTHNTVLNTIKDSDGIYKTGLYVKDSIIGIGTLTFIDPETNKFGALGHSISSSDTGKIFDISTGTIFKTSVTGINRSERNSPGEKNATYDYYTKYGTISKNVKSGIFGEYTGSYEEKYIDINEKEDIHTGDAYIYTVIKGNEPEKFKIDIISVNDTQNGKDILYEVVDEKLLKISNGIVQGMSGSPIIQDDKLIGAVNYVIVDDPHKGYGILISNMLKEI